MELTKTEKMYLKKVNGLEAGTRRGLMNYGEAFDQLYGYNTAIKDNRLNTDKTDCMFEHLSCILNGSPQQKRTSLLILKMFNEWTK